MAAQHELKVGWVSTWISSSSLCLSLSLTILYLQKLRFGPLGILNNTCMSLFCLTLSGRIISSLPPFTHGAPQYWAPPLFYLVVKKLHPLLYITQEHLSQEPSLQYCSLVVTLTDICCNLLVSEEGLF